MYLYFVPEYKKGRRIIWDAIDNDGLRFLDHVPSEIVYSMNSQEMKITFKNGSILQIVGTDDFDKIRGSNPVGCVYSEYAYQNPAAWEVVKPILRLNDGWAVFQSTCNGKNHFWQMYEKAKELKYWFTDNVDVTQATDWNGNLLLSEEKINEERLEGMPEEMIQQEYYNNPNANTIAYYYLEQLTLAEKEGRLVELPYINSIPVDTWWDIGISDATAIWFSQRLGKDINLIDYYEHKGSGLDYYIRLLQEKPYIYGQHNAPHDIKVREWTSGKSRVDIAADLGINFEILPKIDFQDGINATRMLFPYFHIDPVKCKLGIDALLDYKKKPIDEFRQLYDPFPIKNWAVHGADALRMIGIGLNMPAELKKDRKIKGFDRYKRARKLRRTAKSWKTA